MDKSQSRPALKYDKNSNLDILHKFPKAWLFFNNEGTTPKSVISK